MRVKYLGLTGAELKQFGETNIETLITGFRDGLRDALEASGLDMSLADRELMNVPVDHAAKVFVQLATITSAGMIEENNKVLTRQLKSLGLVPEEEMPKP